MLIRPISLIQLDAKIIFNQHLFLKLEIDLDHINEGKSKTRNKLHTAEEVSIIVSHLLQFKNCKSSGLKMYNEDICNYYVIIGLFEKKQYKVVFCICSDRPMSIGVITLFRFEE